jgi:DNA-binding response OmpR family regulator
MNETGHILIIDDERSLRQTLTRILQQAGFEVTTAENAERGLDIIKTATIDLVLTDLRMPGMQGLELLKLITANYPALPVILFTAQPDVSSAVEALRHGATDYLLKPLKPEILIERAKTVLFRQQKEKRKRELLQKIEEMQNELKSLEEAGSEEKIIPLPNTPLTNRYIQVGDVILDLHTRTISVKEKSVNVRPTSFDYLLVLVRHAPDIVDYQTLVSEAQGYQTDFRDAQDLAKWHVHQLRQAVEAFPEQSVRIVNVRGNGYRLVSD